MPDGSDRRESPLLGLSQRLPPSNVQAEQALLGALLADNRAYDRVGTFLLPEHFADPVHGRIFDAIRRRVANGQLADAVTLKAEFEHAGVLDEVGGVAYLAQLLAAMVGIISAGEYGRAVHDAWMRREIIAVAEGAVTDAFAPDDRPASTLAAEAVERLLALTAGAAIEGMGVSAAAAAAEVIAKAEAAQRGDAIGRPLLTGLETVDGLWGGLWPGQFSILMAPSGTGKTSIALQIARAAAQRIVADAAPGESPGCVHFISLEMPHQDVALVSLVQMTGRPADDLRRGRIGRAEDWIEIDAQRRAFGALPIVIDAPPQMTLAQVEARARLIKRTRKTKLLIIDHRDLIQRDKAQARMDKPEWVPALCGRLKALSKALDTPVLALTQINKRRDEQALRRPTLTDLPYGGNQDADVVMCLWRRELGLLGEPPDFGGLSEAKRAEARSRWYAMKTTSKGKAEIGALKRRFGGEAWATIGYEGTAMRFFDLPPDAGGADDV